MRTEKAWKRLKTMMIYVLSFFAINTGAFIFIGWATIHRAEIVNALKLPLDNIIPFAPIFVWIYLSHYIVFASPFFIGFMPKPFHLNRIVLRFIRDKFGPKRKLYKGTIKFISKIFYYLEKVAEIIFGTENDEKKVRRIKIQTSIAYAIVILISSTIYVIKPMLVERPDISHLKEIPSVSLKLLKHFWDVDRPDNTLPSQHATFSFLVFFIFNFLRKGAPVIKASLKLGKSIRIIRISPVGTLFFIWASLIVLSTFFTKQHIILDAVSGIALAWIAFKIGFNEKIFDFLNKNIKIKRRA